MSFIAQRPVRPAESDVTDVDDGGAQIAIGTFWPTVKLHDLRLAARIAGDITTSRLMHMATEAALHVADQLKDWRKQREAEGAESLASVLLTSVGEPVEQINGESAKVYRFRRAVYSFTRASVLEGYRDVGTTPKGDKDAEALDRQIDDLWRDGRWSIAYLCGAVLMKVRALQNDTVDQLCWRHYGKTAGVTEKVLEANPGLSNQIFLNAGQEIEMPVITSEVERVTVQLWE